MYFQNLNDYKKVVKVFKAPPEVYSSCHLQLIKIDFKKMLISKDKFIRRLNNHNIFPQYHYVPIYKFYYYKNLKRGLNFKNTEEYYNSVLSFPIYYNLEKKSLIKIFKTVKKIIYNNLK